MSLVVSSLAATMAITPLIIHIFHSIPIYSIPANLVSDFALTLGLSIGLLSTLIGVAKPHNWAVANGSSGFLCLAGNKNSSNDGQITRVNFENPKPWIFRIATLMHNNVRYFLLHHETEKNWRFRRGFKLDDPDRRIDDRTFDTEQFRQTQNCILKCWKWRLRLY